MCHAPSGVDATRHYANSVNMLLAAGERRGCDSRAGREIPAGRGFMNAPGQRRILTVCSFRIQAINEDKRPGHDKEEMNLIKVLPNSSHELTI